MKFISYKYKINNDSICTYSTATQLVEEFNYDDDYIQ